jgi:hypothetical protein
MAVRCKNAIISNYMPVYMWIENGRTPQAKHVFTGTRKIRIYSGNP